MLARFPNHGFGRGRPVTAPTFPAWRPAAGTFIDLGGDTLYSVRPSGWPTSASAGPFGNWSGARWNPDFGTLGGLVSVGSGHLSAGSALWAGAWVFDPSNFTIVGRCVPSQPLLEGGDFDGYYESEESATLGHPYPPHVYGGLVIQSAANGGGPNGSAVRAFMAGASIANPRSVHRFDLSSTSGVPQRVINDIAMNGTSSSYPAACVDEERGGFWLQTYNGFGPLKFVSFSDWSVTVTTAEYSDYGDQILIKLPPPYDAVVALGRANSNSSIWSYRVSLLTGLTASAWASVTPTGTPPTESKNGASWFASLGEIVAPPNDGGSTAVFRLSIPASRATLTSGSWAWTTETLTAAGGATWPTRDGIGAFSGLYGGGIVEAPSLGCALIWNGINNTVRAATLTGM